VHLGEALGEPPRLVGVDTARRSPGGAAGIQRDQPGGRGVIGVVRRAVQPVPLGEPVPGRARGGPEVRPDELALGDRPAARIRGDLERRAGHERLWMLGEQLERPVVVEVARQPHRLPAADQRRGQVRGDHPDSLVERLVIAEAG
jgi:hypothetical protein